MRFAALVKFFSLNDPSTVLFVFNDELEQMEWRGTDTSNFYQLIPVKHGVSVEF
jgi:hypothetical protein